MWIAILFVLSLAQVISLDIHPSIDEISRAVALKPPASWGKNLRRKKNIRLLTLGGSNTAGNIFGRFEGFVPYLTEYLKANVSKNSHIINEGRSGCSPDCFIGKQFDFESLPVKEWPNVVMLEFSVNMNQPDWHPAKELNRLVRSLNYKWQLNNLSLPEYIILELNAFWAIFPSEGYVAPEMKNPEETKDVLNSLGEALSSPGRACYPGFNRGCQSCAAIEQFACFNAYPLISWQEAAFPAFVRYLTSDAYNSSVKSLDWPYLFDPAHLSLRGWHFFVQNIIGPFFVEQMQPRVGGEVQPASIYSHVYNFDLHMFSPTAIPFELAVWSTSYGLSKPSKPDIPLQHIIHRSANHTRHHTQSTGSWVMQTHPNRLARFPDDVGHECYGSSDAAETATFLFSAPAQCKQDCTLVVSTLHSWNVSYIGNLTCSLWTTDADHKRIGKITVVGHLTENGERMGSTLPVRSVVATTLTAGNHRLTCRKTDGHFTCVDSIILSATLIL